jgi:DnaJ-class molecular chaperone
MPTILCQCGDPHRMIDTDTQPANCIDGEWLCDVCVAEASQCCDRCHGTGELETEIFHSQPPDWRVTRCPDCRGTGESEW